MNTLWYCLIQSPSNSAQYWANTRCNGRAVLIDISLYTFADLRGTNNFLSFHGPFKSALYELTLFMVSFAAGALRTDTCDLPACTAKSNKRTFDFTVSCVCSQTMGYKAAPRRPVLTADALFKPPARPPLYIFKLLEKLCRNTSVAFNGECRYNISILLNGMC